MRDSYLYNSNCKCNKKSVCENCSAWLVKKRLMRSEDCDVGIPIWSMDYLDNLIVVGCANGQIEFWEGTTGRLKVK